MGRASQSGGRLVLLFGLLALCASATRSDAATVTQVSGGLLHSLALLSDGSIRGWGNDSYGQSTPPAGLGRVVQVAAGNYFSLALLANGTVVGFGWNHVKQAFPPWDLGPATQIAAGFYHSLALLSNGSVRGWGANDAKQIFPVPYLERVTQISAGLYHSLALLQDGTVRAWGNDSLGVRWMPAGLGYVTQISAGMRHSVALLANGTVVGWGQTDKGKIDFPPNLADVKQVAAGAHHTAVLFKNGTVRGFGDPLYATPPAGLTGVKSIAAGAVHTLAILADGTVKVWGNVPAAVSTVPLEIRPTTTTTTLLSPPSPTSTYSAQAIDTKAGGGPPIAVIAGAAAGGAVVLVLAILGAYYIARRRRNREQQGVQSQADQEKTEFKDVEPRNLEKHVEDAYPELDAEKMAPALDENAKLAAFLRPYNAAAVAGRESRLSLTSERPMSPPVFGNDPEYQASDIYIDMSLSPLGEGSLGIVYRGALQGNYHVVIKVVRGSIADDFKLMKALFRELKNWEGLAHYNVLPLKGYCKYPPMIVTELMEQGSLRQHLVSRNWDRATGLKLLLDVASGMAYLHSKFILHGDLRDSNILVNGDRALVADFGLYKIRQHIADSTTGAATAGNQGLIAPEIIEGGRWNAPADVYSFAILCYEVLSGGKYPFEGEGSPIAMLYKVAVERARPARPDGISDDMWWLLERCWAHDPKERPTFEEIEHELQYIVKEHGSA